MCITPFTKSFDHFFKSEVLHLPLYRWPMLYLPLFGVWGVFETPRASGRGRLNEVEGATPHTYLAFLTVPTAPPSRTPEPNSKTCPPESVQSLRIAPLPFSLTLFRLYKLPYLPQPLFNPYRYLDWIPSLSFYLKHLSHFLR